MNFNNNMNIRGIFNLIIILERIKLNNLNVDTKQRIKILEITEPPKKKAGIKVKNVEELVSRLHNDEKVI